MMDFLFLGCWTSVFLLGAFFTWKRFVSRSSVRIYFLMLLNLFFLAGFFYFYPLVTGVPGKF